MLSTLSRVRPPASGSASSPTDVAASRSRGSRTRRSGSGTPGTRGIEGRRGIRATYLARARIKGDRGTYERLERVRVDLLPLLDVDRAPRVPLEAGVEEPRRVVQRGALGEGQLHLVLVGLAGADDPVVLPHRGARARLLHPLHLLGDVRILLPDQLAHPGQRVPAPVTQLGDSLIDQLRSRLSHALLLRLPAGFGQKLTGELQGWRSRPGQEDRMRIA